MPPQISFLNGKGFASPIAADIKSVALVKSKIDKCYELIINHDGISNGCQFMNVVSSKNGLVFLDLIKNNLADREVCVCLEIVGASKELVDLFENCCCFSSLERETQVLLFTPYCNYNTNSSLELICYYEPS